jgi:hypothetical protein
MSIQVSWPTWYGPFFFALPAAEDEDGCGDGGAASAAAADAFAFSSA